METPTGYRDLDYGQRLGIRFATILPAGIVGALVGSATHNTAAAIATFVVIAVLAWWGATRLTYWQIDRHTDRQRANGSAACSVDGGCD